MTSQNLTPPGIWLPIITPFWDGELDEVSFRRLLEHYQKQPIDGFIIGATTGEGLTLSHRSPMKEELRTKMFLKRLPGLFDRVKKLERGGS